MITSNIFILFLSRSGHIYVWLQVRQSSIEFHFVVPVMNWRGFLCDIPRSTPSTPGPTQQFSNVMHVYIGVLGSRKFAKICATKGVLLMHTYEQVYN